MCFGIGDIIAISGLAIRVHTAYQDAPGDYRLIANEVVVLQALIDKVAHHLKSTPLSSDDLHDGQKALKGCRCVLENLNSLIEKFKRMAPRLVFAAVKIGRENIVTLQERLILNTGLLTGFVRRFVVMSILLHQSYGTNISTLVVSILRSKQSWLLSLAFKTGFQEFQHPLLLPLKPILI